MEKNPFRVLDCKEEICQRLTAEAPSIQDHLCDDCERDFDLVLETLGHMGSRYRINPRIVRGLDYYTKTTFEFVSGELGAQNAVAGGGRYDGLVRLMGGPSLPGVGFAIGEERLIELLTSCRQSTPSSRRSLFIAPLGEKGLREAVILAQSLRDQGFPTELDFDGKSLKSQMRRADKIGARFVLLLGEEELKKKAVTLRDMTTQQQHEVPLSEVSQRVTKLIG